MEYPIGWSSSAIPAAESNRVLAEPTTPTLRKSQHGKTVEKQLAKITVKQIGVMTVPISGSKLLISLSRTSKNGLSLLHCIYFSVILYTCFRTFKVLTSVQRFFSAEYSIIQLSYSHKL